VQDDFLPRWMNITLPTMNLISFAPMAIEVAQLISGITRCHQRAETRGAESARTHRDNRFQTRNSKPETF
jgi:hypothetical protein